MGFASIACFLSCVQHPLWRLTWPLQHPIVTERRHAVALGSRGNASRVFRMGVRYIVNVAILME